MDKDVKTIVEGFWKYLKEKQKINFLSEIIDLLQKKAGEEELKGEVISAVPLERAHLETLENLLGKKINKKVRLTNFIDKSLIGGLVVRYHDLIIDQSVKGKLKELKKEIYGY